MPASNNPTLPKGVQVVRPATNQNVAYTGTHGVITNAVASSVIRVVVTTDAFIAIGSAPTATTSDTFMPAFIPEYFRVVPGSDKVSAIRSTTSGTLYVTECD